jgi:hypothetical protein
MTFLLIYESQGFDLDANFSPVQKAQISSYSSMVNNDLYNIMVIHNLQFKTLTLF